jgi:hypothetical protein
LRCTRAGTSLAPAGNTLSVKRFPSQPHASASGPPLALPDVHETEGTVDVKITLNDKNNPPGKLADAEIHFTEGVLAGLKLIGFAIWERRTGGGRNVTLPSRQYSVNGERRSFALLRPVTGDATAQDKLRELVLQAYAEYEERAAVTT